MSKTINLITEIAQALGLDLTKPISLSPRSMNIVKHYQCELDRGHMTRGTALERCLGDLAGRNYNAVVTQRDEVRL
jgi:hypothetical protein